MTTATEQRGPQVFDADDPRLEMNAPEDTGPASAADETRASGAAATWYRPTAADLNRSIGWGGLLVSAALALAGVAASLWFARFVSIAVARNDWIGWAAFALLCVIGLSAAVLVLRELVGMMRLGRLGRMKKDVAAAIESRKPDQERRVVARLKSLFAGRPDMKWHVARLSEHERAVLGPGELLALTDRDLVAPIDQEARRAVLKSAKRVSVVTAISPMAWIAMLYVLIENVRLLRVLGGLYGGRPGLVGSFRLARLVIGHIIATGGVAFTDDLLGQFLGQDLLRRLSRRLGEGAFNGALTARIGAAAIEVIRPLPFISATPVRARDIIAELFKRRPAESSGGVDRRSMR
jgi:putative membrane protein